MLIVYGLVELIIETSHSTKDFLIVDIHTHHTCQCSMNATFNECHIHLCDCTWLNIFSHAESLLIKLKKIFAYFSCFWKVFWFCKNVKNFKNSVALFWRLSCRLVQSRTYIEIFRGLLVGQCPSLRAAERFYAKGFGFLFDNTSCVVLVFASLFP